MLLGDAAAIAPLIGPIVGRLGNELIKLRDECLRGGMARAVAFVDFFKDDAGGGGLVDADDAKSLRCAVVGRCSFDDREIGGGCDLVA